TKESTPLGNGETRDSQRSSGTVARFGGGNDWGRGRAMPWWAWVMVGALLLGAESFLIPTDFFLVFVGGSAIAVGVISLAGMEMAPWLQWTTFAVFSLLSLVIFRGWLKARLPRPAVPRVDDTFTGEIGMARERLAPGAVGRVDLRGTSWSARNVGDAPLEPGARVRVERVDGLTLHVRREA